MNIIVQIIGGIGKTIAFTAVAKALKKQYPDSKIIVFTESPSIFKNNPNIFKAFSNVKYNHLFYKQYIQDKDVKLFVTEPFLETGVITEKHHIIEGWCNLMNIPYNGEQPEMFLSEAEEEYYRPYYTTDKPLFVIQTNGGVLGPQEPGYNWVRDLPENLVREIVDEYKEYYTIVHIKRKDQTTYQDTFECVDNVRGVAVLLLMSEKRILMDSFAQHMAAALDKPSTVCWIGTSPISFGYKIHDNILPNTPDKEYITDEITFTKNELWEPVSNLPYTTTDNIFEVNKIFQSINKQ
jgi:hypothetical protein|tara:strand:- start:4027 stop:4908 length:882 start_codon:yes stop_codon:yes gene_type:complete